MPAGAGESNGARGGPHEIQSTPLTVDLMRIKHFLYNAFIIENGFSKIAIDPGQNLWMLGFRSLIPRSEWAGVTHVLITHGDPDHHWQSDRLAEASGAWVVCGRGMTKVENGRTFLIAPRKGGPDRWTPYDRVFPLDVGVRAVLDGVEIEGLITVHGPIEFSVLGCRFRKEPGPGERVGLGAVGFKITVAGRTIVNLGDSILQPDWEGLAPDVLMIPIGGLGGNTWTMNVPEAIDAVRIIRPKMVIPCHYNAPFLWIKNAGPADDREFKSQVEQLGAQCRIMKYGDEIKIGADTEGSPC